MREIVKSVTSLSWALSLLGARQLKVLMSRDGAPLQQRLERMTQLAENQLEPSLQQVFEAGDRLQRSVVDFAFTTVRPDAPGTPGQRARELATDVIQQSSSLLRGLLS